MTLNYLEQSDGHASTGQAEIDIFQNYYQVLHINGFMIGSLKPKRDQCRWRHTFMRHRSLRRGGLSNLGSGPSDSMQTDNDQQTTPAGTPLHFSIIYVLQLAIYFEPVVREPWQPPLAGELAPGPTLDARSIADRLQLLCASGRRNSSWHYKTRSHAADVYDSPTYTDVRLFIAHKTPTV